MLNLKNWFGECLCVDGKVVLIRTSYKFLNAKSLLFWFNIVSKLLKSFNLCRNLWLGRDCAGLEPGIDPEREWSHVSILNLMGAC